MLRIVLIGFLSLTLMGFSLQPAAAALQRSVNAVLGDRSYSHRFGHLPGPEANETLRIQTHLAYVEGQLRRHTPQAIPAQFHAQRRQLLDFLHQYWTTGVFPSQNAYPGRRPHFIDEQGRLCAVGHLIAQSAGRGLAERINARYRYAYLPEMQMPELDSWVASSGLTARELAMIQPTYGMSDGGEFMHAYTDVFMPILSIVLVYLFIPHLVTLGLEAEVYQHWQSFDQFLTGTLFSLGAFSAIATPFLVSQSSVSSSMGTSMTVLMVVSLLFAVPLNLWLMWGADSKLQAYLLQNQQIHLGPMPLADGSSAWGLQASLLF